MAANSSTKDLEDAVDLPSDPQSEKLKKLKGSIRNIIQNQNAAQQERREMMNREIDKQMKKLQSQIPCSIDKIHRDAIFSAAEINDPITPNNFCTHSDETKQPLYMLLKVGDSVLSRYSNGNYYQAVVKSVTHGGYPSAQYDVEYPNYFNERQTVSWKNLLPTEEDETKRLSGNKRSRISSDPLKDEYGRDRRDLSRSQPTSKNDNDSESESIADLSPALLNRPKGAWKKK
jgi:hypothetical protein